MGAEVEPASRRPREVRIDMPVTPAAPKMPSPRRTDLWIGGRAVCRWRTTDALAAAPPKHPKNQRYRACSSHRSSHGSDGLCCWRRRRAEPACRHSTEPRNQPSGTLGMHAGRQTWRLSGSSAQRPQVARSGIGANTKKKGRMFVTALGHNGRCTARRGIWSICGAGCDGGEGVRVQE